MKDKFKAKRIVIEVIQENDEGNEKTILSYEVFCSPELQPLLTLFLMQLVRETHYESFLDWIDQVFSRAKTKYLESEAIKEFLPEDYNDRFYDEDGNLKEESIDGPLNPYQMMVFGVNKAGSSPFSIEWHYLSSAKYNFLLDYLDDDELSNMLLEV
jgi:hypothetical protein